jgi:hypothetical protein
MSPDTEKKHADESASPPSTTHDQEIGTSTDLDSLTKLGYTPELRRNRSLFTLLFQSLAIAAIPFGEGGPLVCKITVSLISPFSQSGCRGGLSNLSRPLLLVLPNRQTPQNNPLLHNRLDLAHRKLDHNPLRKLRIRLPHQRLHINVPPRLRRHILATPPNLLRHLPPHIRHLRIWKPVLANGRHHLRWFHGD